ncbi:hypothetical protein TRIATDRAFT_256473 [Trichoderma atroviride IMI 206040]|uniref:Uncharacterized protein n=1 Tax=Hypocrea atroviridis (strain ATCC 20476 / IMI 206040) TaxID=452589 RepID=G9NSW9_HYPAI|nr:uncharacterized protein TRIATDRAFT_299145 [Trichoderma atroviride IMI 206040]EHK46512.1 hypothetical protein TRIATDRAFT_256473 [Trichoderma atroviride IMI 206040]
MKLGRALHFRALAATLFRIEPLAVAGRRRWRGHCFGARFAKVPCNGDDALNWKVEVDVEKDKNQSISASVVPFHLVLLLRPLCIIEDTSWAAFDPRRRGLPLSRCIAAI